jgi:hypothetical protein
MRSGDDDIIPRKPLHERRAAFDAVAARRAAAADDGDGDDFDYDMGGAGSSGKKKRQRTEAEEDEFYTAAKVGRGGVLAFRLRLSGFEMLFVMCLGR